MAQNLTVNGSTYAFPTSGDPAPWGDPVAQWAVAVTTGMLQKAGGLFALTADADFGPNFALQAIYFKSRSSNIAQSGVLRLANGDAAAWRNAGNTADLLLKPSATGDGFLSYNGVDLSGVSLTQTLTNKTIDATTNTLSNIANASIASSAAIAYSKLNLVGNIVNADIANSAAVAYSKLNLTASVVNADIASGAAIAVSKLAALTVSRAVVTDGSGVLSAASTTATQVGYLASAGSNVHGDSDAATLTNKTFGDAPIFTQVATPANPSSGLQKIYPKTDGYFYSLDSAGAERRIGSGAGTINYFSANPDAESGTSGWTTYADGAATPVDLTGGSPTATWAQTGTNPLRGSKSFKFTPGTLGDGVAFVITPDRADAATMLQIDFDYEIETYSNYTDGDLQIWFYDVGGSVLVQPGPYKIVKANGPQHFRTWIQTSAVSTMSTIRVGIHQSTSTTTYASVRFENFACSAQRLPFGCPVTDPVAYTPTFTGFGTVSAVEFYSYRDGAYLIVEGNFTAGTSTATEARISLGFNGANGGITSQAIPNIRACGDYFLGATATSHGGPMLIEPSQTYLTFGDPSSFGNASVNALTKANGSAIAASGNKVSIYARIPVSGWSSNVQMSNDADTRVVAMNAYAQIPTGTIGAAWNVVKFGTVNKDTHAAYSTSTGLYTAPVSGWYLVAGSIEYGHASVAAGNQFLIGIGVNGSNQEASGRRADSTTNATQIVPISGHVYLNAGDTTGLYSWSNGTTPSFTNAATASFLSIQRISGPSAIAATESVNARYYGSSTSLSGSLAAITYNTKDFDSHNAYSAGTYTIPVSGKYQIFAAVNFTAASAAAGNQLDLEIWKSGSSWSALAPVYQSTQTLAPILVSDIISCVAGDTIQIKASSGATTPSISASNTRNYFSITRVGN